MVTFRLASNGDPVMFVVCGKFAAILALYHVSKSMPVKCRSGHLSGCVGNWYL